MTTLAIGSHPTRLPGLDGLRGLAVSMVLVFHLQLFTTQWWPAAHPLFPGDLGRVAGVMAVGVDLFYVLSGFFIGYAVLRARQWDAQAFAKNRLTRIIPAYYVSMLLTLVLVEPDLLKSSLGWLSIALHVLMLHNGQEWTRFMINGSYWTLGVECAYYFLMLALAPWWRSKRGWIILPVFVLVAWLWRISVFVGQPEASHFFWVHIPSVLDEFAMGMLVAYLLHHGHLSRSALASHHLSAILVLFGGALAGCVIWGFANLHASNGVSVYDVVFSRTLLCSGFAVILIGLLPLREDSLGLRLLNWSGLSTMGKLSYSVYLYHTPVWILIYRQLGSTAPNIGFFVLACFLCSLLVAWCSHRWVEMRWHPSAG